jgi:hypothetical protein
LRVAGKSVCKTCVPGKITSAAGASFAFLLRDPLIPGFFFLPSSLGFLLLCTYCVRRSRLLHRLRRRQLGRTCGRVFLLIVSAAFYCLRCAPIVHCRCLVLSLCVCMVPPVLLSTSFMNNCFDSVLVTSFGCSCAQLRPRHVLHQGFQQLHVSLEPLCVRLGVLIMISCASSDRLMRQSMKSCFVRLQLAHSNRLCRNCPKGKFTNAGGQTICLDVSRPHNLAPSAFHVSF